jgi:hypothetical protein
VVDIRIITCLVVNRVGDFFGKVNLYTGVEV